MKNRLYAGPYFVLPPDQYTDLNPDTPEQEAGLFDSGTVEQWQICLIEAATWWHFGWGFSFICSD